MDIDIPEVKSYLLELYNLTEGDTGVQASMYEVGVNIGLQKNEAGTMAEDLIVQGWVELVSLSGGISITAEGIEKLQLTGSVAAAAGISMQLGTGPVLNEIGLEAVEKIVAEIKTSVPQTQTSYPQLEEMIIDLKTIETQMLSPNPKVEVIRELLRSLQAMVVTLKLDDLSAKLKMLIAS